MVGEIDMVIESAGVVVQEAEMGLQVEMEDPHLDEAGTMGRGRSRER